MWSICGFLWLQVTNDATRQLIAKQIELTTYLMGQVRRVGAILHG